jgi:hypothetical protein
VSRNDGAQYEQRDEQLQHEAWLRHEIARVACECARCGGRPENAAPLERALLTAAHLEPLPERDDSQPDLFQHAA